MWDPIAYALGFLDCHDISARCMLSIFHFFATKTDASVLRMLNGSPRDRLLQPIVDYITSRGGSVTMRTGCQEVCYEEGADGVPIVSGLRLRRAGEEFMVHADCYVAALDCQGAKKLVPPAWRKYPLFDNIHKLVGVPVITVQLRHARPSDSAVAQRNSAFEYLSMPPNFLSQ
jgi:zeta-carotene desaturase